MIGALISKIWPWIALAAAVVAGFFGVRISARREGAANERARQAARQREKEARADEARDDVERLAPDARRERLRKWSD